jgi:hypothetical protein
VLEAIADEMLDARGFEPGQAPAPGQEPDQAAVCRITAGATPVVTSPSDSPLQFLYAQLAFGEDGTAERASLGAALQRLGRRSCLCQDLECHGAAGRMRAAAAPMPCV